MSKRAAPKRTIGDVVREAREGLGLSQRALALKAGLDPSSVNHLELDKGRMPRFDTIAAVALALNLSLDDLAARCGLWPTKPPSKQTHSSKKLQAELDHVADLVESVQDAVAALQKRSQED